MHTWDDEITTALRKNGESWEDIEYTPFTDEQLGMSPDDSDGDLHFDGHDVAVYTEEWLYYVDFDLDWGMLVFTLFLDIQRCSLNEKRSVTTSSTKHSLP